MSDNNTHRNFSSMLLDVPIKGLLVLGFLLAGLLPVMAGALVSFETGRKELKEQAFRQLEGVRAIKSAQIERFFDERLKDASTLSADPALRSAFGELCAAYAAYGSKSPNLFHGLDKGRYEAPAAYVTVHDRHFDFLAHYTREQGYYDLLLLDGNGAVCFSVEKEADFGRIHADDASSLSDAWRAVKTEGKTFLSDMKLYAPSKDAPAQFAAAPITGFDGAEGVLVLQISLDSINAIMGERSGMGKSGESLLVGADRRMRSDSVSSPGTHGVVASFRGSPEKNGVTGQAVSEALSGRSGSGITDGYRGEKVLSAYAPLSIGNARWAILVEIEEREIDHRINQALSGSFILILCVSTIAVLLLALMVSALIARHLRAVSRHFTEMTEEVLAGRLSARGDPSCVGVDFKALVERTNNLIEAFVSRLDLLPVPVIMLDCECRLRFLNSAAAELCGQERSEITDSQCCTVFNCGERGNGSCPALSAISSGSTVHGETVLATARGSIPVSFSSSPVRHPDGRLLGAWQILIDQSAARRMAAENRRLENQLFRAQRLDALGTLSSGIAHDFNNILSYMLVYADLIAHDIDSDSFARKNLDQITEAIERAAELVRQMLVFSRQMDGKRIVFDAAPVVCDTLKLFSASLPENIAVQMECAENAVNLEGDPTHLRQVVMNLCSNARDAMSAEGGTIRVALAVLGAGAEVDSPPLPPGSESQLWLHLTVSDEGCGMDEKIRERIFEPFFTTKAPGKGTGLGLAVVHGIVSSYGGAVTVKSAPEHGTTMEIYLPGVSKDLKTE